ncbi:hypothetical protein [Salinigranum marinum]|uniref:hypothetical protein n=1 Tax=Salinigranum marinum TaxID=1515595 RepID=UPI002989F78E|nr:hypothetical protein [Salinigranum marinum]
MEGGDEGMWRTLARIYVSVLACGVCVPGVAALPVLFGFGSFFVTLLFGVVGLGAAGGVVLFADAQFDAAAVSDSGLEHPSSPESAPGR